MLTRRSRDRDLRQHLAVWEPLIGAESARTALRGRWWGQAGFLIGLVWMAAYISLDATHAPGVALGVSAAVAWPVILFCLGNYVRLSIRAQRQGGLVAGTSPRARPPVNNIRAFNRWQNTSKYSRGRDGTARPTLH